MKSLKESLLDKIENSMYSGTDYIKLYDSAQKDLNDFFDNPLKYLSTRKYVGMFSLTINSKILAKFLADSLDIKNKVDSVEFCVFKPNNAVSICIKNKSKVFVHSVVDYEKIGYKNNVSYLLLKDDNELVCKIIDNLKEDLHLNDLNVLIDYMKNYRRR